LWNLLASALVKFPLVIRMDSKGWLRRNGYRVGLVLVAFFASVFLPALAQTTDWASLIQAAKPAVVWILAETPKGTSAGSGAIISPDGYILTAAHVIEGASRIKVVVEESREFLASVVNADSKVDVAILKISASGLTWFGLGDSDKVAIEEQIRVLGYPLPRAGVGLIAVAGVIQGTRVLDGVKLLQHNASTTSGHSGGPVINARGEIIGIHSARLTDQPEYRLAVAVNEAKRLIPWGVLPSEPSPIRPPAGLGLPAMVIRVPQDQPDLSAAVRAAPEGGEIQVAWGTYRGDITITRSIQITGEPGVVIEGTVRVSAARSVTLTNLEIRGALEIRDAASFTLALVTVKGSPGDGVVIEASSGAITGCTIEDAQGLGIVVSFGSRVTIVNCAVRRSAKAGISLTLGSQARITGCTIEGNGGDGVYIAASTAELRDNTIQNNRGWGIAVKADATVTPPSLVSANLLFGNAKGPIPGFVVSDLKIDPEPPVLANTQATITAKVTNVSDEAGTKEVWLSLNGSRVQAVTLSLQPWETKTVTFTHPFVNSEVVAVCADAGCSPEVFVSVWVDLSTQFWKIPLPEGAVRRLGGGSLIKVVFSPDWRYFAVATSLGIELWDASSMELVRFFPGPWPMAFSPDGKILALTSLLTPSCSATITLWDVANGTELRTLSVPKPSVLSVAFSPDGQILASGLSDGTIKLWDVATGTEIRTLRGHTGAVNSVAFSPDGKTLASGSNDDTIKLWDVATGTEIRTLRGRAGEVYFVVFSPDGKILASGSAAKTIKLWDVATGTEIRTLAWHDSLFNPVAFSPDGKILALGRWGGTIQLWDVATGTEIRTIEGHTSSVVSVAFSPDGKTLASGSADDTIKLWDVATGTELRTLRGHTGAVYSVAFSPDGKILALGLWGGTIQLWDVAKGTEIRTLEAHTGWVSSVAFSPDGQILASGLPNGTIKLWDVAKGAELHTLFRHKGPVNSVAFSPDGKTLASGSDDRTIKLWDVVTGTQIRTIEGHTGRVNSVAFSPDGKTLASGSDDRTIKLWNVATGTEIRTLRGHTGAVNSVAFSPDGKTLASGSKDDTIKLWDVATGTEIRTFQSKWVNSVAFSPDGKVLASGSDDKTIKLWDVTTGRELRTLTGHTNWVRSVAFSPDGKVLASGSADGTILLWDVEAVLGKR